MSEGHEFLYEFGPFTISCQERVLLRDGVPVGLAPKALAILLVLIRNSGHLVSKDQLMSEVWPTTYVEESNLTQNISILRKVLDDGTNGSSHIETVPRRGYRFLAPVRKVLESATQKGAAAVAGTGVQAEKIYRLLAILPFINSSDDHQMEYLSDGITESIISSLSHLPRLRVMSRNRVFRFKGRDVDAQRIGRELGVDAVLLGRVRLVGGRLLISTELVDVANGWHLWGENYDSEQKAILEVQDQIARQISTTLRLKLTGDDEKHLTRRYTESADAYQAYLQGRYHWSTFTRHGLEQATSFFHEAINLDPNYALAYSGIVDCYLRLATNYIPPAENQVRRQVTRNEEGQAISADHDDVDEPVRMRYRWDWTGVERELKRATELKSNYPSAHQWHAAYVFSLTLFKDSLEVNGVHEQSLPLLESDAGRHASQLVEQIRSATPTPAEEIQIFCTIAREQIGAGNYEGASQILKRLWTFGEWPSLQGLSLHSAGDLLFTAGSLTGWLAGARQVSGGQKLAEALLNGSLGIFENLGLKTRSAEAQIELSFCYVREGLFDLARLTMLSALKSLTVRDLELKSLALIRMAIIERESGRLREALPWLTEAGEVAALVGPWATGRYHLEIATTLKNLAVVEMNNEFLPAALEYYQKALFEFEAVGNHRYVGVVENNQGYLLLSLGQYEEAHEHLLRARNLFESLTDRVCRAQVDETLARLHIAQGEFGLGEEAVLQALDVLETGDGGRLLTEALVTRGLILSRLGRRSESKRLLDRASQLAERGGDIEGLSTALLTIIEEMREDLADEEKRELAVRIRKILSHSQQPQQRLERLKYCLNLLVKPI